MTTPAATARNVDILILGAGYGGLHVAQRLGELLRDQVDAANGDRWSILVVDRSPKHQLTTELPRLVSGQIADSEMGIPLDELLDERRVTFQQTTVKTIDAANHRVETTTGAIGYRYLVIALGSVSNDFGVPGVSDHMRPFLTIDDARELRIAVARAIEDAARLELDDPGADPAQLAHLMTVAIVGGGATGVEVAGELAEFMAERWAAARAVAGDPADFRLPKPRIMILDGSQTILSGWSPRNVQAATKALFDLRVELRLGCRVAQAAAGRLTLATGETIEAKTLVWCGGVRAPRLLTEAGFAVGSGGRVIVDQFQRVPEETKPNIWVVGDCALLVDPKSGRPLPPTADLALREGETAALAIAAIARGQDPARVLKPMSRAAVSVGRERGAASVLGIDIRGRAAHTLKDVIEWEYRQSITKLRGFGAATAI